MLKNKVAFLLISTELGGAEQSLLDIIKYYIKAKSKNIVVISPKNEGPLLEEFKKLDVPVTVILAPSLFLKTSRSNIVSFVSLALLGLPSLVHYIFQLYKALNRSESRVIHSTGLKNHILLCLYSLQSQKKIIIHLRDFVTHPLLLTFFRFFKNKNTYWITTSDAVAHKLPFESKTFYSGFNTEKFFKNKNINLKTKLKLSLKTPLIGHVGVLAEWKGQREFLKAAHQLIVQDPQYHFVVVGSKIYTTNSDNSYLESLRKLAKDLNIEHCVSFMEFQRDMPGIYNSLDLLVHSSTHPEPFGRVIAEALFCELPVIASNHGGTREIFPEDLQDFLVDPKHTEALSCKMRETLSNPNLESQMKELHYFVSQKFNYDQCFQKLADYIENPI